MIASLLSPTWSNDETAPHILFFPAPFLSVTVLAVNLLGDGLRDALDPRMAKLAAHGTTRGGRFVTLAQVETLERLVEGDSSVGIMTSAFRVAERTSSCRSAMRVTTMGDRFRFLERGDCQRKSGM
jgi:hypothetical protein